MRVFRITFFATLLILTFAGEGSTATNWLGQQMTDTLDKIPGLTQEERSDLQSALQFVFGKTWSDSGVSSETISALTGVMNTGVFELSVDEESNCLGPEILQKVAQVTHTAFQAIRHAGPPTIVEDLARIAFARQVSPVQLAASAKSLDRFLTSDVDPDTYREIIAHAMNEGWSGEVISKVSDGLLVGSRNGLDTRKLALAFVIGVDQELDSRGVDEMIAAQSEYLKQTATPRYDVLRHAVDIGLPIDLANEVYYVAIEEDWPLPVLGAAYKGLLRSMEIGLSLEQVALAIFVRGILK